MAKASVAGAEKDPPDLKGALKREREEHQHLLADSYAAVMDLTKQLQISERNWGREKLELLERFNQERSQWEQRLRDVQSKGTQVSGVTQVHQYGLIRIPLLVVTTCCLVLTTTGDDFNLYGSISRLSFSFVCFAESFLKGVLVWVHLLWCLTPYLLSLLPFFV